MSLHLYVNFDELEVVANDNELHAVVEGDKNAFSNSYKTKHFHLKYDPESQEITEINTEYGDLMGGRVGDYEDTTVVDVLTGDVYTLEELFLHLFNA